MSVKKNVIIYMSQCDAQRDDFRCLGWPQKNIWLSEQYVQFPAPWAKEKQVNPRNWEAGITESFDDW